MPQENTADITIILDRSGSMQSIADDTIGGFNRFLDDQKTGEGEAVITLVQFDDRYEVVYSHAPLDTAPHLTRETFVPRGSTALVDAIGTTIDKTGERLAAMAEDDRPEKVIVMILTDGMENASTHYTMQKISEMIRHQEDVYKWKFVFLGANQDAIATAASYGISADASLTYASSGGGVAAAFASTSERMRGFREQPLSSPAPFFEDEDREKQEEELAKKGGR